MKSLKSLLAIILTLSIGFSLLACEKKVNLQTEDDAIEYLEDYVERNDRWRKIANELKLYSSVVGSSKFNSTSYAKIEKGSWMVVLHGSITGYTDYNETNRKTFDFSYVAWVTTDGKVSEIFTQEGCVTDISIN
ncbi:MAG: hypothetical protein IKD31_02955 [Clostridia bacterium]|nr:hypothetical protein [Clostridia bacterium]